MPPINMSMWNRLTPISEADPVITLAEAKAQCNVSHSDEDAYLNALIEQATDYIGGPKGIGVALTTQTYRASLDHLCEVIRIPLRPIQAIVSITYVDPDGVTQTVDPTAYWVDLDQTPAIIKFKSDPPAVSAQPGAVKIVIRAGYGDSDDVPGDLKGAARLLVAQWYRNREAVVEGSFSEPHHAVTAVLTKHRNHLIG